MENATKAPACKLTTPEFQKRRATVIAELKAFVLHRKEVSHGMAYYFPGTDEILDKLITFIKTERICCDFFTFELIVDANKVILNMSGPEGAKQFLREEVGL